MKTLLKGVKIIDNNSEFNGQVLNVLIANSVIEDITQTRTTTESVDLEINGDGMYLCPGLFDLGAHFNDPGEEHKEDVYSGIAGAIDGGYTSVALLPNTEPVIQNKASINYLINKAKGFPINIFPLAAVSQDCKGEQLTEMIDADASGAIAFTDGLKPIWHTDVFMKALIYMQKFDGLLINRPEEKWLSQFGSMHEGIVSTTMGLKGMPSVAEEIMIERDLRLLRYVGEGRLHFAAISAMKSVGLIRKAKEEGLQVTCSVTIWNLLYTDESVEGYRTNFKLNPPLRTEEDRKALIEAVLDGTVDVIITGHRPHDEECKKIEFDLADFGAIGLQTMLPCLLQLSKEIPFEQLIEKTTHKPREVLKLRPVPIAVGNEVNLTLFDPNKEWTFDQEANASKSNNSPVFGQKLKGKVLGTFLGDEYHISPSLKK